MLLDSLEEQEENIYLSTEEENLTISEFLANYQQESNEE